MAPDGARTGRHGDPGNRSHLTVPLVCAAVAGACLVISIWFAARGMGYPSAVLQVELAKGLGFVVVTAVVIGLALQRMNQAARAKGCSPF